MTQRRDDAVSYEHDYREVQGPVHLRTATPDLPWWHCFAGGYCPRCLARLSCERTLCFADERENECSECRIVWAAPDWEGES